MRIEKRRIVYGSVIGAGTFIMGVLFVWITTSVNQVDSLPEWKAALWVFLDANGVTIEPTATQSPLVTETAPNLPAVQIGYALPLLLVVLATILAVSGVSGTARYQYMIENGAPVIYGYLGVGLISLLISGARPVIAALTALVFFFLVAIYLGSAVTGAVTGGLPFIGIAPLGLVAVFGLVVILVGGALLTAMLPMIIVSVSGVPAGVTLLWAVRKAPR